MGILGRVFSTKNKRSKAANQPALTSGRGQRFQEDEETATRLLRSSSSRFAIISEVDYMTLPPIPHPINNVVPLPVLSAEHHPQVKSPRSEYNVKVYRRADTDLVPSNPTLQSHNERPKSPKSAHNQVSTLPLQRLTPQDHCRLHALRSDPSIANLAQMYDEHGHLNFPLFSDSPSNQTATAQAAKGGPTFRELLRDATPVNGTDQGLTNSSGSDISWAEKYLDEHLSSTSSATSSAPQTPDNPQLLQDQDVSFSTDPDVFSSLDVEASFDTIESRTENANGFGTDYINGQKQYPFANIDPATPQRASQVFGFLNEKRHLSSSTTSSASPLPSHASRSSSCSSRNNFNKIGIKPLNAILRPSTLSPAEMIHTPPNKRMSTPQFPYAWEEDLALATPSPDRGRRLAAARTGIRNRGIFSRFASIQSKVDLGALADLSHGTYGDKFTSLPARRLRPQKVTSIPAATQTSGVLEEDSAGKRDKAQHHVKDGNILNPTVYSPTSGNPTTPSHRQSILSRFAPSPVSSTELSPAIQQLMKTLRMKARQPKNRGKTTK